MISNNIDAMAIVVGDRRCLLRNDAARWRLAELARPSRRGARRIRAHKRAPQLVTPLRPCLPDVTT
jgi:hypothetical protein